VVEYHDDSERAQQEHRDNIYVGVASDEAEQSFLPVLDRAFQEAWRQATGGGAPPRPLRVESIHVWGRNPPNWCKVVLSQDV
jgi:hypothetical protein